MTSDVFSASFVKLIHFQKQSLGFSVLGFSAEEEKGGLFPLFVFSFFFKKKIRVTTLVIYGDGGED